MLTPTGAAITGNDVAQRSTDLVANGAGNLGVDAVLVWTGTGRNKFFVRT